MFYSGQECLMLDCKHVLDLEVIQKVSNVNEIVPLTSGKLVLLQMVFKINHLKLIRGKEFLRVNLNYFLICG